ncbi:hypothetical protein MA16_Dca029235 [Dendrobium catenatum]|uniref:Uncharacterized protein n=1 Tax=Dendrobium catenatum TaxID=906689 RepID=A0A2I0VEH8_9ASPA|nr:hypothetical protein MA16_Dca029235 [Dendrobium catenatum]
MTRLAMTALHRGGVFFVVVLICFESIILRSSIDFLDVTQLPVIASCIIELN